MPTGGGRRLRLVANNTRFLVLPDARVPNLASRVLSLSLHRLSADMEAARWHPVLPAEPFGGPARFGGPCRRAANRPEAGLTRGQSGRHGGREEHGRLMSVFVRAPAPGARPALAGPDDPAPPSPSAASDPPEPERLRNLYGFLHRMSEYRSARGIRHPLPTVLSVAAAATLAGARRPTARPGSPNG